MSIQSDYFPLEKGAALEINLQNIQKNYFLMKHFSEPAVVSVVLKANAYGLGLYPIAEALVQVGVNDYFVSTLEEGMTVRRAVPKAHIYILNGVFKGTENVFEEHHLIPVLLSLEQIQLWRNYAASLQKKLPAILQVNIGMGRFGLSFEEAQRLSADDFKGISLRYILGHLSSASLSTHPHNMQELKAFQDFYAVFPNTPATLANSPGILLGSSYHFDMTRIGIALYGGAPLEDQPNPLYPVLSLKARVLQVRSLQKGMTVGYDGTYIMPKDGRIATVNVGFADGFLRALSNKGYGKVGPFKVPIAGRISMDWMSFDVSDVPEEIMHPGALITLLDDELTIDAVASMAQTTSYDLISGLGSRLHRVYVS